MKAFQNLASPGMPSCSCEYPRVLRHLLMLWLITLPAMAEAFPQALWQKFARAQHAELLAIDRPAPDKAYVLRKRVTLSPAQLRRSLAALKVGVGEFRGTRWTCFNPHHQIRIWVDGQHYLLDICFECSRIEVGQIRAQQKLDINRVARLQPPIQLHTSDSPKSVLDGMLQ